MLDIDPDWGRIQDAVLIALLIEGNNGWDSTMEDWKLAAQNQNWEEQKMAGDPLLISAPEGHAKYSEYKV